VVQHSEWTRDGNKSKCHVVTENPAPVREAVTPLPVLIYRGLPAHQIQAQQSVKTAIPLRDTKSWKFGFRERVESCRKWISLGPCSCSEEGTAEEDQAWIDAYILSNRIGDGRASGVLCKHPKAVLEEHQDLRKSEDLSPERVFCKKKTPVKTLVPRRSV
jgi:hypothetical protein